MRVMAQMAMVMNLDKCIGCHTCSVTCKQAWTNQGGTEYVWFNNVETRPGLGYPPTYEDQDRWGRLDPGSKGGCGLLRRRPAAQAASDLLQPEAAPSTTTTSRGPTTTRTSSTRRSVNRCQSLRRAA